MSEIAPGRRIAVIDDEPIVADTLVQILRMHGYEGRAYYSGEGALADRGFRPEVVLSDVRMPGMDGIETARRMRDVAPGCRIILFTASPLRGGSYEMIHQLGFEFLERPLHPREVLALLASPQWPCAPALSAVQHGGHASDIRVNQLHSCRAPGTSQSHELLFGGGCRAFPGLRIETWGTHDRAAR